jgi:very-short-patch-repair endonuclease
MHSEEYCYLNDLNYEEEKKKISEIIKNAHKNYKGPNVNSKECFIKKYGKEEGLKRYLSHIKNVVDSNHRYSNISKEFFEKLIEKTNLDKSLCFYAENEKRFDLSEEEQKTLNRKCIYVDFLVGNKIIEYNGLFWHEKDRRIEDFNRKIFLEKMGYEVLTVWDKTEGELERAINFINSGRYKILTSEGYSDFDGISKKTVNKILKITLKNNQEIEVSENHNFIIQNVTVKANTLKIGDCLEIKNNILERITNIEIIEKETEVYDILETKNHTYYANDILNHNCEFMGSSYTLIDADILKNMKYEDPILKWDNRLDVFVEPIKNHKYIMAVDPAKGGLDAFAVQVIDVTSFPFGEVASAQIFKCNYQIMPEFLNEWGHRYNNAYMIIENNEGAGTFIANMMHLDFEYENLFFAKKDNGAFSKEPGFRTTTRTRKQILETFKHFVDNRRLIIRDKKTINELYTFIIKDNKYQADDGSHDDMIMSLALAFVPFISSRNFEDMKDLIKKLYSDEDLTDTSFSEYLAIGNFDISVEEESIAGKPYDERYNYSYEYYSKLF